MRDRMTEGDVVEVVWRDATFRPGPWYRSKELEEIRSVGYVLRDDEELFVLGASYWPDDDEYGDAYTIPADWVVDVRRLKAAQS